MLDIQQDEYLPVWGDTGEQLIKTDISVSHPLFTVEDLSFYSYY